MARSMYTSTIYISIHAPRTGSDADSQQLNAVNSYFNPRSPHGERRLVSYLFHPPKNFNPRSPHGERLKYRITNMEEKDFNPRSPHGERRDPRRGSFVSEDISIHAPRTGSDICPVTQAGLPGNFNPRSPHGERHAAFHAQRIAHLFQSTLPARGATPGEQPGAARRKFQSTLPARGATFAANLESRACEGVSNPPPPTGSDRFPAFMRAAPPVITTPAPRTGSDGDRRFYSFIGARFQSTLPARGATPKCSQNIRSQSISIHAPRTGSDTHAVRI